MARQSPPPMSAFDGWRPDIQASGHQCREGYEPSQHRESTRKALSMADELTESSSPQTARIPGVRPRLHGMGEGKGNALPDASRVPSAGHSVFRACAAPRCPYWGIGKSRLMGAYFATGRRVTIEFGTPHSNRDVQSPRYRSIFYLSSTHNGQPRNLGIGRDGFLEPVPVGFSLDRSLQAKEAHTSTYLIFILSTAEVHESNPILVWRISLALGDGLVLRVSCKAGERSFCKGSAVVAVGSAYGLVPSICEVHASSPQNNFPFCGLPMRAGNGITLDSSRSTAPARRNSFQSIKWPGQ